MGAIQNVTKIKESSAHGFLVAIYHYTQSQYLHGFLRIKLCSRDNERVLSKLFLH